MLYALIECHQNSSDHPGSILSIKPAGSFRQLTITWSDSPHTCVGILNTTHHFFMIAKPIQITRIANWDTLVILSNAATNTSCVSSN